MQNVPYGYYETVTQAHRASSRTAIFDPVAGLLKDSCYLISGSVQYDATASTRAVFNGTFLDIDGDLLPDAAAGLLAPYGNEIRAYRGVWIPPQYNGYWLFAEFPLGVFRISSAVASDDGSSTISVTAYDRSRAISRNGFIQPWLIGAGANTVDSIVALVQDRLPYLDALLDFQVTPSSDTMAQAVLDTSADPWAEIQRMAAAISYDAFFNGSGQFVLQPSTDPTAPGDPTWAYVEGVNSMLLPGLSKESNDDPGINGVVLTSESTTLPTPVKSVVWDANPDSPTYYLGKYGKVPVEISNPYVTTQAQGDAAALLYLARNSGGTEQVSLVAVPNPAQEVGDAVRIRRNRLKIDRVAVIDQMTISLSTEDSMPITTRRRRALS